MQEKFKMSCTPGTFPAYLHHISVLAPADESSRSRTLQSINVPSEASAKGSGQIGPPKVEGHNKQGQVREQNVVSGIEVATDDPDQDQVKEIAEPTEMPGAAAKKTLAKPNYRGVRQRPWGEQHRPQSVYLRLERITCLQCVHLPFLEGPSNAGFCCTA